METAVFVRKTLKKTFGIAALLACGFAVLQLTRPDLAAQLTGAEPQESATDKDPLFGTFFSSKAKSRDEAKAYKFNTSKSAFGLGEHAPNFLGTSRGTASSGQSSRDAASEAGTGGKLRQKFGDLAFGTAVASNQYVPFQFQAPGASKSASNRKAGNREANKRVREPSHMPQKQQRLNTIRNDAAPVPVAYPQGRYNLPLSEVHQADGNSTQDPAIAAMQKLNERIHDALKPARTLGDDARIATVLLEKAKKDIRLAPTAIAAIEAFTGLYAGTPQARRLQTELAGFKKQYGEEIRQRSTLEPNAQLGSISIKADTLSQMRSCLARDKHITALSVARKTSVAGVPALFAGVSVSLLASKTVTHTISTCLAPLYQIASVTILSSRFGSEAAAAKRIMTVKNAAIYWTGFASVPTRSQLR